MLRILVVSLLACTALYAQPREKDDRPWPKTVEEALDVLERDMADEDKRMLATLRPSCLITMHFGWGMGLRNGLPIWGNEPLMKDARANHADDVSGIIMARFCERLFSRLPEEYRNRVTAFNRLLEQTKPTISGETTFESALREWNIRLRVRASELKREKSELFQIRIKGENAAMKVPPDLFRQKSIAEFLDSEGLKLGLIYYEGDVLWIDGSR
jgi:hypothetical protein